MDTIVLCKMFHSNDPPEHSKSISSDFPILGYSTWVTRIRGQTLGWIKINCHELLRVQNVSKDDIKTMTNFLDRQLAKIGLTHHDFNVRRIDYDYNVVVNETEREALMEILSKLPQQAMRMDRAEFPQSVYYMCKSRHFQIYDKVQERINKGKHIKPWEVDVLRQEVQCLAPHIRHMKRYHGLLPSWDNWVDLDLQTRYLRQCKPIFPKGDFYSLNQALEIVDSSNLRSAKKRSLCDDLIRIAIWGLDAMKESYSLNTYKNHLACFEELGVSPLTLPSKYKHLGRIKNPFFV